LEPSVEDGTSTVSTSLEAEREFQSLDHEPKNLQFLGPGTPPAKVITDILGGDDLALDKHRKRAYNSY
jgi:hypothetical protein